MLLINNLSFSRNKTKIFENLNLSLNNKGMMQIKGKNGSGKTTFLKVILNIVDAVFTPFSTISLEAAINKKSIGIYYPEDVSELDPTFATVTKRIAITEFISDMKPLICTNKQELTIKS